MGLNNGLRSILLERLTHGGDTPHTSYLLSGARAQELSTGTGWRLMTLASWPVWQDLLGRW